MRSIRIASATAALVLLTGGAAAASEPDDDGFVPVPAEEYGEEFDVTIDACGSTLTVSDGDVRELETKVVELDDGALLTLVRGGYTVDVERESDGARLEEVPNDGRGFEWSSGDGTSLVIGYEGPALFFAVDEVEAEVYEDAGLPEVFFFTDGYFEEAIEFSDDAEAPTIESAEVLKDYTAEVFDVCELLDEADEHGHVDAIH